MSTRSLTRWQVGVLGAAAALMVAVGAAGAAGTYTNAVSEFHRQATAAGVVAAGEGLTLILAMVMLGRTMLGQSSPAVVRLGMWLAPVSASCIGLTIASSPREAAVYAVTPLAMSGAAEGLGFIARSVVVYTSGTDAETLRRNADAARQLAYYRAVADGHPDKRKRKAAVRRYWRLARHVGVGDTELGAGLIDVQRHRVREGADAALAGMYGAAAPAVEVTVERVEDDQPEPPALTARPLPEVVPASTRMLPIVARPEPAPTPRLDHTQQSLLHVWKDAPKFPSDSSAPRWTVAQPVMPPVPALESGTFWDATKASDLNCKVTAAVPAETGRQVVTETIIRTPSELRREARRLNREAVRSTNRPVTIKTLQDELGLSRREATDLRRAVVGGERS